MIQTNGFWKLVEEYVDETKPEIVKEDELQRATYTFKPDKYNHYFYLKYEPFEGSSIPAYEQRIACTVEVIPKKIFTWSKENVQIHAEYIMKNEYAGISLSGWVYSNDDRVVVTNNNGYAKGEFFAGDRRTVAHDELRTTFSISVPQENIEESKEFIIYFETDAGRTAFKYQWVNE